MSCSAGVAPLLGMGSKEANHVTRNQRGPGQCSGVLRTRRGVNLDPLSLSTPVRDPLEPAAAPRTTCWGRPSSRLGLRAILHML